MLSSMNGFVRKLGFEENTGRIKGVGVADDGNGDCLSRNSYLYCGAATVSESGRIREGLNEDLGEPTTSSSYRVVRKSALVYSFTEALRDSLALSYFIQYMDGIGQLSLIKFWLHVESFKASASNLRPSDEALVAMTKNDARYVYAKYICEDAPCSINITDCVRRNVIERICREDGIIDAHCFDEAQQFLKDVIETRYFSGFLSSIYYMKHQLDVISYGTLTVFNILQNHQLLTAFVEYLEGEGERKLIEFIICVQTFDEQLESLDDDQAVADAMIIYNRFFSMQAPEALKFGAKTRIKIESDICTESGRPAHGCFDGARYMAMRILERNYLKRFSASPAFVKYVRELIAQVEGDLELPNLSRLSKTGTNSDHSSDRSLSTSVFEKGASYRNLAYLSTSLCSANFPVRSEDDETASQPESFSSSSTSRARRSKVSISLATIDDLGRYCPMYDNSYSMANTTSSARRKIRSKLDKYLRQSMKKESEVADQVAQLIIADIHNMVSSRDSSKLSNL